MPAPFEIAVEVTRGALVECQYAAAVAVADTDGALVASLGDAELPVYLRSSAKPFQAASIVASGAADRYGFTSAMIALVAGSHAGEDLHAETAAQILDRSGVEHSALGCGIHAPFSRETAERLLRERLRPTTLRNNCSGKHAGMLAAARLGGHALGTYLDPAHPVQRAILESVSAITGRPPGEVVVAIDGCSAPTFGVPLREAARGYARLMAALERETHADRLSEGLSRVAVAMRAHPEMVAGDGMLDTELMRSVPGLIAKVGADGVHLSGWLSPAGPLGVAVKLMDGDVGRGRTAVVTAVLQALGALPDPSILPLSVTGAWSVKNHRGVQVGTVRPVLRLHRNGRLWGPAGTAEPAGAAT